jgi:hypothetical protein
MKKFLGFKMWICVQTIALWTKGRPHDFVKLVMTQERSSPIGQVKFGFWKQCWLHEQIHGECKM